MKLLLDVNLSPKLVSALINSGVSAVHWISVGAPDASDTEIISYAKDNDLVVVTHDLDFSAVLSVAHGQKPSVIQIRAKGLNKTQITEMIVAAVKKNIDEIEKGAVISINTNNSRIRLLPM